MRRVISVALAGVALIAAVVANAGVADASHRRGLVELTIEIENEAPDNGTFQTPVWLAVHDGTFDTYDRGAPASAALERLAEDGSTGPLSDLFGMSAGGRDFTVVGPNGAFAPDDEAKITIIVDPLDPATQWFSYASMVIPSNDAFVANGDPMAHRLFDERGRFVGDEIEVPGSAVLDAGTEVNDELPVNTAFFGQAAPDTGVTENGVVQLHDGFMPVGSGGILDAPMFADADFTASGYETLEIKFEVERLERFTADARLSGDNEVPPVVSEASGRAHFRVDGNRRVIRYSLRLRNIGDVAQAHIHLAPAGENGPVAAFLVDPGEGATDRGRLRVRGTITADDVLTGTFAELVEAILDGGAYVNVHTEANPGGEVRGQIEADD